MIANSRPVRRRRGWSYVAAVLGFALVGCHHDERAASRQDTTATTQVVAPSLDVTSAGRPDRSTAAPATSSPAGGDPAVSAVRRIDVSATIDGTVREVGRGMVSSEADRLDVAADDGTVRILASRGGSHVGVPGVGGRAAWFDASAPMPPLPSTARVVPADAAPVDSRPVEPTLRDGLEVYTVALPGLSSPELDGRATLELGIGPDRALRRMAVVVEAEPAGGRPVTVTTNVDLEPVPGDVPRAAVAAAGPLAALAATMAAGPAEAGSGDTNGFRRAPAVGAADFRRCLASFATLMPWYYQLLHGGSWLQDVLTDEVVPTLERSVSDRASATTVVEQLMPWTLLTSVLTTSLDVSEIREACTSPGAAPASTGDDRLSRFRRSRATTDPHLTTFDGTAYDLMAVGEFVGVAGAGLEVQLRLEGDKGVQTYVTATAARIGRHVIEAYLEDRAPSRRSAVRIDGVDTTVGAEPTLLDDGTSIAGVGDGALQVVGPGGDYVLIERAGLAENVVIGTPAYADSASGLLGDADGDLADDLALPDGTVIAPADRHDPDVLYGTFADAWRVTADSRLFTRGDGAAYLTARYTTVPRSVVRRADLPAERLASARATCRSSGVSRGDLDACVYDVAATGDDAWADVIAGSVAATASGPPLRLTSNAENGAVAANDGLLDAASRCDEERVGAWLDGGADLEARDDRGATALLTAVRHDCADVVATLLALGADVDASDAAGWAPLHGAADYGDAALASILIDAGADVDRANEDGLRPLHEAARRGWDDVAAVLLAAGARPDATDDDGRTPLYVAAAYGQPDLVVVLLGAGADPDAKTDQGWTPLDRAVDHGHGDVVDVLLTAGARPDGATDGAEPPIIAAAIRDRPDELDLLVAAGADIDATDDRGRTALWRAADRGLDGPIAVLLAAGASIDVSDRDGATALHAAARADDPDAVAMLLAAGASPTATDANGHVPGDLAGPRASPLLR